MSAPKYIVLGIRTDQLDAGARQTIASELKDMLAVDVDDPIRGTDGVLSANHDIQVKFIVYYTRHLAAKWLGADECRTITDAEFDAWWDAHKDNILDRRTALIAAVDKPSFTIVATDNWKASLADIAVEIPPADSDPIGST